MALVNIKGYNSNLLFIFEPGSYEDYIAYLTKLFTDKPLIFQGSSVLFTGEGLKTLAPRELAGLQKLCLEYGLLLQNINDYREKGSPKDVIIHRTLRSGQQIHSEGSIIVWGNVNESAEITAGGDVIVLGRLEGIAHAGCYGNTEAYIMALSLCPRQLRIGDRISRASEDSIINDYPEIAYVEDDNICIKQYDPRDPLFK